MTIITKTIGRLPVNLGDYDSTRSYGKKNRCNLYGCEWESRHDNNTSAPAVWDGGDTITPNTTDWILICGSYEAWLMNQNKRADAPFGGLGRVTLKKNIQNIGGTDKNVLTQDMFYKDDEGSRVPNTNTIFVIKYDFDLNGETITLPSNTVLHFDGGSVKNGTIEGNRGKLMTYPTYNIFNNTLIQDFCIDYLDVRWFGAIEGQDSSDAFQYCINSFNKNVYTPINVVGHYIITKTIECDGGLMMYNDSLMGINMLPNRMNSGVQRNIVAQIDVNLDDSYDCVFHTNVAYNPGKVATICVSGVRFVNTKYKSHFDSHTASGDRPASYFVEQDYIQEDSPYTNVLFKYDGGGMPVYQIDIRKCYFEAFAKVLYFTGAITQGGSTAYHLIIDFCEFRNCNYGLYANQEHEGYGPITVAGVEIKRSTLKPPTKIFATGVYGSFVMDNVCMERFYQDGDIFGNATYPMIYISMRSTAATSLKNMYLEKNRGNIVIESDDENRSHGMTASLEFSNGKMYNYLTATQSEEYNFHLYCKNITVLELPQNLGMWGCHLANCILDDKSVNSLGQAPLRIGNISQETTANGNSIGCCLVKTAMNEIVNIDEASNHYVPCFFNITGYETVYKTYRKGKIDYYRVGPSSQIIAPLNILNGDEYISRSDVAFVFYKTFSPFSMDFLGDEIDGEYEVIDSCQLSPVRGFQIVSASFSSNNQQRIKAIRLNYTSGRRARITDIAVLVRLDIVGYSLGDTTSLGDCCVVIDKLSHSGTFANKPAASSIYPGYKYFCTDKQTPEGQVDGIEITHKGGGVWVDALGRTVS